MDTPGFISVPALLTYLRQAEELGLERNSVLSAIGASPSEVTDNSKRLPSIVLERLLAYLLANTDDRLIGLHAARFVQPGTWSVLGYITMNCATLGDAMQRIVPYEKLVGDMGTSRVETENGQVRLIWNCRHTNSELRRHMIENVLASWLLYARWIADTDLAPEEVWFEHAQPEATELTEYQQLFGCPVRFSQSCSALLTRPEQLQLPLRQANAGLLRTLEEHALQLMAGLDHDEPLPLRVKNALRLLLKDGMPRKERVAEKFHVTARTLQRHLQQAGSGYQEILDELRRELAEHYLLRSDLSVQEIASYLGFSEPRSFHRSFKHWTGMTPGEYREQHR
jgi:AraC-like DNA-binding protein